jgi:Flp pilus assembly pilin Flp
MMHGMQIIHQFYRNESGVSLVEYTLLVMFIGIVALVGAQALGLSISSSLNGAAGGLK